MSMSIVLFVILCHFLVARAIYTRVDLPSCRVLMTGRRYSAGLPPLPSSKNGLPYTPPPPIHTDSLAAGPGANGRYIRISPASI